MFFSKKLVIKFFKYSTINKNLIKVELDKKPSYNLIYNLKLVELEILKTYIIINLANNFD